MRNSKYLLLILILILASIYMTNTFSSDRVDLVADAPIDRLIAKDLKFIYQTNYCVEYDKKYYGYDLTMAQGNLLLFNEIEVFKGTHAFNEIGPEIIIGDNVANHYYKSNNVIGKTINLYNKDYKIIGLIKDSDRIIIPYESRLANRRWDKITMKLRANKFLNKATIVKSITNSLERDGVGVTRTIDYKTYMDFDKIILAVIIIIYIYMNFRRYLRKLREELVAAREKYDDLIITFSGFTLVKKMKYEVIYLVLNFLYVAVLAVLMVVTLNFFKDYGLKEFIVSLVDKGIIDMYKDFSKFVVGRMTRGFEKVELHLISVNLIGVAAYFMIIYIHKYSIIAYKKVRNLIEVSL